MRVTYQPGTLQFALNTEECGQLLAGNRLDEAAETPDHHPFELQLALGQEAEPSLRLDHGVLCCRLPAATIKAHAAGNYPDDLHFAMSSPGGREFSMTFSVR